MTTANPTTPKEFTTALVQQYTKRRAKELADMIELERAEGETFVLRFRYGRASEPFKIQGTTSREQLRDLGVHIERFLGAR